MPDRTIRVFKELWQNAWSSPTECLGPGCSSEAHIWCHSISRSIISNELCDPSGKTTTIHYDPFSTTRLKLKRKPASNVLTFKGYCKKCDNNIFRPIEHDSTLNPHHISDKQASLLSLRPIAREYIKALNNIKWYNSILDKSDIKHEPFYLSPKITYAEWATTKLAEFSNKINIFKSHLHLATEAVYDHSIFEHKVSALDDLSLATSNYHAPTIVELIDGAIQNYTCIPYCLVSFPYQRKQFCLESIQRRHPSIRQFILPDLSSPDSPITTDHIIHTARYPSEDVAIHPAKEEILTQGNSEEFIRSKTAFLRRQDRAWSSLQQRL